jgi:hypothetical protein
VWLSNPFSNTGLNFVVRQQTAGSQVVFSPDPNNQPVPAGTTLRQAIDIVSGDLEQPSIWKANLAFEHELPWWGVVASAEAILTQTEMALYYQRLDLGNPTRSGQDGRMMYWNAAGYSPANWERQRQQYVDGRELSAEPRQSSQQCGHRHLCAADQQG